MITPGEVLIALVIIGLIYGAAYLTTRRSIAKVVKKTVDDIRKDDEFINKLN